MTRHLHIVGAGVAGLAAACRALARGASVSLYEMAGHAGGRCRSFHDDQLGAEIDNGNHLILSGNRSIQAFMTDAGADPDGFSTAAAAGFDFFDLQDGREWRIAMNDGCLPLWIFDPDCRAADTGPADYLAALKLLFAGERTVSDVFGGGAAFRNFWEPLSVAILNTEPDIASAGLLWPVLRETVGRGGKACRPMIARKGLGPALIDPAVRKLEQNGATVSFGTRLRKLEMAGNRLGSLSFDDSSVELGPDDAVILAVSAGHMARLTSEVMAPDSHRGITNLHFRMAEPLAEPGQPWMRGIVGGISQWVFIRDNILSVTVSVAEVYESAAAENLATVVFEELRKALGLKASSYESFRIIREKRATFTQSAEQLKRRSGPETAYSNMFLAGDWTSTGLPATIEGAVRSGHIAVAKAMESP